MHNVSFFSKLHGFFLTDIKSVCTQNVQRFTLRTNILLISHYFIQQKPDGKTSQIIISIVDFRMVSKLENWTPPKSSSFNFVFLLQDTKYYKQNSKCSTNWSCCKNETMWFLAMTFTHDLSVLNTQRTGTTNVII